MGVVLKQRSSQFVLYSLSPCDLLLLGNRNIHLCVDLNKKFSG